MVSNVDLYHRTCYRGEDLNTQALGVAQQVAQVSHLEPHVGESESISFRISDNLFINLASVVYSMDFVSWHQIVCL